MYAITAGDRVRRGLAYAMGVARSGSAARLQLARVRVAAALPLRGRVADRQKWASNEQGLFGISWPSPATAARLLFGESGLVVITPVVLCAAAALVPLYRRGFRREAMLIGGLALAFLVYNAGYEEPFGGVYPGPRFLIAVLPFLAVPLALSYALWPLVTSASAVPSVVYAIGITVTVPLEAMGWDSGSTTPVSRLARLPGFLLWSSRSLWPFVLSRRVAELLQVRPKRPEVASCLGSAGRVGAWANSGPNVC